jgi:putative membrane protein
LSGKPIPRASNSDVGIHAALLLPATLSFVTRRQEQVAERRQVFPAARVKLQLSHRRIRIMNVSKSILFLALAGASTAAMAADAERTPPAASVFVKKAALDGMTEVEAGKVALNKSQDPQIRSFAQRMVKDHGKAGAELESIAKAKGLDAPKQLDTEHKAMLNSLEGKSGADFDRAYSEHMNMDHSKAIALFESASLSDDAQLAQFAKKTLPTLQEHKELAQKLPGN